MSHELNSLNFEMEDTIEGKFLSFPLHDVLYGVPIRHVTEVIRFQEITQVPHMPFYIKGVINLRGKVIPVMDVRLRFVLPERSYDDRTCIVIIDFDGKSIGLIVDTVEGVVKVTPEQIEPPPKMHRSSSTRFIAGMGKLTEQVIILLNADKLLYDEESQVVLELE